jgi:hypothetical protein
MSNKNLITEDEMFEPIVTAIQEVSDAFKKLQNSKVKDRVILLLLKDSTGLNLSDIEQVLKAAANLKIKYLK